MDYTTVALVKEALHGTEAADDNLLSRLVTAASRATDVLCTGVVGDSADYFKLENVIDQRLTGQIDYQAESILVFPHKPIITVCSAFAYQKNITTELFSVDPARVDCDGPQMRAYPGAVSIDFPARCRVVVSFTGGFSGSQVGLPGDLVELVTLLAARLYREAEGSLGDAIGVAEMSQMIYTKALPQRYKELIQPYIRRVGWRHVS